MTSQSTALMLAQMLQKKKSASIEPNSHINAASVPPHPLTNSLTPALAPNQAMEQVLTNILGASFNKNNTPME